MISDNETHEKGGVIDTKLIPQATALDPEVMQGLPSHTTAATKLIFENLSRACSDGSNLEAGEAMALASYYGGLAITQALVGYVHAVSHNLGARYGIPRGLGNAMVLPHVLELLKEDSAGKMAELAVHAGFGSSDEPESLSAQNLVDKVWQLNREIGIPETSDAIRTEDIEALIDVSLDEGSTYPTPRFFDRDECRTVLERLQALQDSYQRVEYISDGMSLEALLDNRNIVPGEPKPALVYLHGGFGLRYGEMVVTQPFTDAGYIVLAPSWRGENSNPGYFECFLGEVRDAKAAIRWLAQQDYVDRTQIYVFGWSVGGGIALNLALQDDIPVRLSGSSAGVYNADLIKSWATEDDFVKFPYDYLDKQENYFRLPLYHLQDLVRPHYSYIGAEDDYAFVRGIYDELYPDNDTQLRLQELPGDHMGSLPVAVREFLRLISSDRQG